jgi:hypothetical protein
MTAIIELYANNAYSSLSAVLTDTATTINLESGTGARFPTPVVGKQFFRLVLTSASSPNTIFEIVYCTQRVGDVLTVLRGQEGTTAQAWAIDDLLGNEPTAGMFNQFMQPFVGVDTGVADNYVVSTPQHETAYYTGMLCTFYTLNPNTTNNPWLNLNGLGQAFIKNANGSSLLPGQLPANTPITVQYNSSDTTWRLLSPFGVPTSLTPLKAVVTDSVGRITNADPSVTQVNYLNNWIQAITGLNNTPGWIQLSNGLFVQWGSTQITGNPTPVFFARSFPNNCLSVVVTEGAAGGTWTGPYPSIHGTSFSDGNAYYGWAFTWSGSNWVAPSGAGVTQNYIAIGY